MAQFIARMFTPSDSTGPAPVDQAPKRKPEPVMDQRTESLAKRKTQTRYAGSNMTAMQADTAKKTLLGQ